MDDGRMDNGQWTMDNGVDVMGRVVDGSVSSHFVLGMTL